MKTNLILTTMLALSLTTWGQQALWSTVDRESPKIHPDHSVTVSVQAPSADVVKLKSDMLPGDSARAMSRAADGVWHYTTPPLPGELYTYTFERKCGAAGHPGQGAARVCHPQHGAAQHNGRHL